MICDGTMPAMHLQEMANNYVNDPDTKKTLKGLREHLGLKKSDFNKFREHVPQLIERLKNF